MSAASVAIRRSAANIRKPSRPFMVATLALVLLFAPLSAPAQNTPRLGVLSTGSPTGPSPATDALLKRLHDLGWIEGRTLVIERRWAEHSGQFPALASELVAMKVNVILTPGPHATSAAKAATTTIPIVMVSSADPVTTGLVSSLARPGGNLTGVTVAVPELFVGKRLEILAQTIPGVNLVAVFWDASVKPPSQSWTGKMDADALRLGLRLHHARVRSTAEFESAFQAARAGGSGAVLVMETPLFTANATLVAEHGVKYRLPVMTLTSQMAERGALVSYGPDLIDLFLRAAVQVDKILRGASPATLPIEQPTRFPLVINLKTARTLGITIPPSLLLRADRVIE